VSAPSKHLDEARAWLADAERPSYSREETETYAAIAQVHATLALVEQQRISNLIALDRHTELTGSPEDWQRERVLRADVREALGL